MSKIKLVTKANLELFYSKLNNAGKSDIANTIRTILEEINGPRLAPVIHSPVMLEYYCTYDQLQFLFKWLLSMESEEFFKFKEKIDLFPKGLSDISYIAKLVDQVADNLYAIGTRASAIAAKLVIGYGKHFSRDHFDEEKFREFLGKVLVKMNAADGTAVTVDDIYPKED